jgi:hypothetical protein
MAACICDDVGTLVASHLAVWERISASQACTELRHMAGGLPHGDFAQVQNKYYTNLQLLDQYREWNELRRMKQQGVMVVFAPVRFTRFVCAYNNAKRRCGSG